MGVTIDNFDMEPGNSGSEGTSATAPASEAPQESSSGCCGGNVRDKMERLAARMLRVRAD